VRSSAGFGGCFSDLALIDDEFKTAFLRPIMTTHEKAVGYSRFIRGLSWKENDAFRERHADIRAPVLFVWGKDDPTFPEASGRVMARQLPNCVGFESIPHAKLLPHEEHPAIVAAHLNQFLAS
jgi:haloalkane dehalogenase